jgi:hypothetical protein
MYHKEAMLLTTLKFVALLWLCFFVASVILLALVYLFELWLVVRQRLARRR